MAKDVRRHWPGSMLPLRGRLPGGLWTQSGTEGIFSQGEWQLLSIARAAAADPAVLLLDEITANLDAERKARGAGGSAPCLHGPHGALCLPSRL